MKTFLAILFAILLTSPLRATECETPETLQKVADLISCSPMMWPCKSQATFQEDLKAKTQAVATIDKNINFDAFPTDVGKPFGCLSLGVPCPKPSHPRPPDVPPPGAALRMFVSQYQAAYTAAFNGFPGFQLEEPHAVDYNEAIQRYQCEATFVGDFESLKTFIYFSELDNVYAAVTNPQGYLLNGDPNQQQSRLGYLMIADMLRKNRLDGYQRTMNVYDNLANGAAQRMSAPHAIQYTYQQTASGPLIQLVNSWADHSKHY